jgi:AraC family transcriptional regulator, regulatory protein of adaptative response / methylated-DNA-[protein]-cysteine methyltransferase
MRAREVVDMEASFSARRWYDPPTQEDLERCDRVYVRLLPFLSQISARWASGPLFSEAASFGLGHDVEQDLRHWVGVSPQNFLQALERLRRRAMAPDPPESHPFALEGLKPSKAAAFIAAEIETSGPMSARGADLDLTWGYGPSPFGEALIIACGEGVCGFAFMNGSREEETFLDMRRRWSAATWTRSDTAARARILSVFSGEEIPLVLLGSRFQMNVWKALLRIPANRTMSYADVAALAGRPGAFRATGAAIGANPISLLIPCHRALARDGGLTGYHWGVERKIAMLGWESVWGDLRASEAPPR